MTKFIQYLDLPSIPENIIAALPKELSSYKSKLNYLSYNWSEDYNEELNIWCKQNIAENLYFAFMLTTGDLVLHKDVGTSLKLNYVINPGGENVLTRFYNDDKEIVQEYKIPVYKWYLLKADSYHSVNGIEKNQFRFSVTAKIF